MAKKKIIGLGLILMTLSCAQPPDTYSFSKRAFLEEEEDIHRLIFGGSEYVKDGLLPLTEWLGPSEWTERLLGILDDIWANAPVETEYGRIPSESQEVNGEMLQTLARMYWLTGNKKYLEYTIRLADYYLFDSHPTRDQAKLRLRDHGCEILSGLDLRDGLMVECEPSTELMLIITEVGR